MYDQYNNCIFYNNFTYQLACVMACTNQITFTKNNNPSPPKKSPNQIKSSKIRRMKHNLSIKTPTHSHRLHSTVPHQLRRVPAVVCLENLVQIMMVVVGFVIGGRMIVKPSGLGTVRVKSRRHSHSYIQ